MFIAFFQCAPWLTYKRDMVVQHAQYWRLLTAPLCFYTWQQLLLNLSVFYVVGSMIERKSWSIILYLYLITSLLTSLYLLTCQPQIHVFSGLSGFVTALCMYIFLDIYRSTSSFSSRLFVGGMLFLILLKTVLEALGVYHVWSHDFVVLWEAHGLGILASLVVFGLANNIRYQK